MQHDIQSNLGNPHQLETLYRTNKPAFKSAFNALYPQVQDNLLAEVWHQRLNYGPEDQPWGTPAERVFVVAASLVAALLAKLPALLSLDPELFFSRNAGFVVFPILIAWFAWKNSVSLKTGAWLTGLILASILFINTLAPGQTSDTLLLSCLHLPLCLWALLGFTFGGGRFRAGLNWLGFLRYNGELAVIIALLLISGGLTTAITLGLFKLIGWDIETVYFNYVVTCGLAAVPIVGTFLVQTQPTLVNRVSPVIARLFSPVALVMLVVYLVATLFSGKNPYQDRDFLVLFNALLLGVMALIFFSVAETTTGGRPSSQVLILFLLSMVTLLVNGIALSAVLFRIAEWGITPNRAAILGANLLMLVHLVYVATRLWGVLTRRTDIALVGKSMAIFLPIYGLWSAIVTFLFPLIFKFL